MIYATCLLVMLILSQPTINFSDFSVNIWVASIMIYAVQVQRFFNQVYMAQRTPLFIRDNGQCT